MTQPSVSVIIPTKNRPDSLMKAIEAIGLQTVRIPIEVVVVDQSKSPLSLREEEIPSRVRIKYHWNPSIPGLAPARNVGIGLASGGFLVFFDDDVRPHPYFVEGILRAYDEHPDADGICGVPDDYFYSSRMSAAWERIFMCGPFWNDRMPVFVKAHELPAAVKVTRMSGGMMSVKRSSLGGVRFDENLRGVSDGEDVDFCMQLGGTYYIDPRCKLTHDFDPVGRETNHWTRRHARAETYLYHRHWSSSKLAYGWLRVGWTIAALAGCLSRNSSHPLADLRSGIAEGRKAAKAS